MKKSLLLIPLLLVCTFTFAVEEFPAFPMTIYWNIKIWSTDVEWWTLNVYNSSNQELTSYQITEKWKYWSENVEVLPLLLNKFSWNLTFKLDYKGNTYTVDSIDDTKRRDWCPKGNNITFASNDCRYDIVFKKITSSWNSSSQWSTSSSQWSTSSSQWSTSSSQWSTSSSQWSTSSSQWSTSSWKVNNDNNSNQWDSLTDNKSTKEVWTGTTTKDEDVKKNENNTSISIDKNNNSKSIWNNTTVKDISWYQEWNQSEILSNWYTREFNNAYKFAYKNGITTTKSIDKAKMNSPLTRIAMAKMLSNYAINVLWKKPANINVPNFYDVPKKLNDNYDNAISLAYQLWIMGQGIKNNKFRPTDEVTRAEFATALSRMLYGTEDGTWKTKYYEPHITKLYEEWIINKKDPKIKEKRWYVMVMLMRAAEISNN